MPGGLAAVRAGLPTPALRDFAGQSFLAASWYDAMPMPELDAVAAKLCGREFNRFVRESARVQAAGEFRGVYRAFLTLLAPATVATYLPRLSAQYYDFGEVRVRRASPHSVDVVRAGLPRALVGYLTLVGEPYLATALELSGARCVRFVNQEPQPDGARAGYALVRMNVAVSWEQGAAVRTT